MLWIRKLINLKIKHWVISEKGEKQIEDFVLLLEIHNTILLEDKFYIDRIRV